jgi:hypothetical protein
MAKTESRLVLIWLTLIALTLLSFGARESGLHGRVPEFVWVILLALSKVRFVILDFMEVRGAPLALRMLLEGWVIVLATVLLVMYD